MFLSATGRNYLSELYNDEWMRAHGFLAMPAAATRVGDLLSGRDAGAALPPLVVARTTDIVGKAIATLQEYGISQMPVSAELGTNDRVSVGSLVGSVSDRGLLERAIRDPSVIERTVGEVMSRPLPLVDAGSSVDAAFELLSDGAPALVVVRDRVLQGIATRVDLLEYLNRARRL